MYSFEVLEENLEYLRRHLSLNKISNTTVMDYAVLDYSGMARFRKTENRSMGRVDPEGKLCVKTISLDDFVEKSIIPDYLKIDVEGSELSVLIGAKKLLCAYHPVIFLSTHGLGSLHHECLDFLTRCGYKLKTVDNRPLDQTNEILAYG